VQIVSVTKRGTSDGTVEAVLSDGSSFFIAADLWDASGLQEDASCEPPRLAELEHRTNLRLAQEKAADYLSRRDYSAARIELKLRQRGFDREVAREAVTDFQERGFIDDYRFAVRWVEIRMQKHPEGEPALRAGLARQGVDRHVTERVIADYVTEHPDAFETALAEAVRKVARLRGVTPESVGRKLLRRGFPPGRVTEVVRRLSREEEAATGDEE